MNIGEDLEKWLRGEAAHRLNTAEVRRGYARAGLDELTYADRQAARTLSTKLLGRRIQQTTPEQDEQAARAQERIAAKLEAEARDILAFADFVRSKIE